MDGDQAHPLTTEQAKARLRAAAERASPAAWLYQHPWSTLGLAIAAGFVVSRFRFPMTASTLLTRSLTPLLLGVALRKITEKTQHKP